MTTPDDLVKRVLEAWSGYERHGETCSFEGHPMIYASILEEFAEIASRIAAQKAAPQTAPVPLTEEVHLAWRGALKACGVSEADRDAISEVVRGMLREHPLASQAREPEWMPIDSAPKDGKPIILGYAPDEDYEDGFVSQGFWMEEDHDGPDNMGHDAGFVDERFDFFRCARSFGNPAYQHKGLQPTHWKPMGSPPQAEALKEGS